MDAGVLSHGSSWWNNAHPHTIALGHGVTGWVGANKHLMVNADAELDLGEIARITCPPLRLCMSVPVLDRGVVAGVLTVYSPYAFSETDHILIESLAERLPSALSRAGKEALFLNPHLFSIGSKA